VKQSYENSFNRNRNTQTDLDNTCLSLEKRTETIFIALFHMLRKEIDTFKFREKNRNYFHNSVSHFTKVIYNDLEIDTFKFIKKNRNFVLRMQILSWTYRNKGVCRRSS